MVRPESGAAVNASEATATPTAEKSSKKKSSKKKSTKPKPLTSIAEARAREGRRRGPRAGRHDVARRRLRPARPLRVLIGRPVGDATGGYSAYFFTKDGFVGKDAQYRSSKLEVAKQGKATITLRYGVYKDGDKAGQPSGTKRVRFRLDGGTMTALDTVPAAEDRFQRSGN